MDPRVHRLQGKAERVKPAELLALLQECYRDRLRLMTDHQASARQVGQYHLNNTYQYVIAREETHLRWVADAIARLRGRAPDAQPAEARAPSSEQQVIQADLEREHRFVDRWQPRIRQVTNARERRMLDVILGESLEHAHFFAEALAGDTELLGRSITGAGQRGTVIADRWLE